MEALSSRGARGKTRGEFRFMKLMKKKKVGGNYAVFYFTGKDFFFNIHDVITSLGKGKSAGTYYLY
jgi:hypothetical protein